MKDFASKLNLYETLSMLIPGSTLLFVLSSKYDNRIDFYNWICENRLGKTYGRVKEITCSPFGKGER